MGAAETRIVPHSYLEQLREARAIVRDEAAALVAVAERLDTAFCAAVERMRTAPGRTIVTGMGKAGIIGRKIAATLSSTGTRAHFVHPAEALHGDLGCIGDEDVLLVLSNSGETEEIVRLLPIVRRLGSGIVAVTASRGSALGAAADVTIAIGRVHETGPHGLAPSSSTTAMLAVGDALALVLAWTKGFTPLQFATYHPGGSLGRKLSRVDEVMRRGHDLRIANETDGIRDIFTRLAKPGRRSGAVMLVDDDGRLTGLFTDSDLARLLERGDGFDLDRPVSDAMTADPVTVPPTTRLGEVVDLLSDRKLSELPVVDGNGRPIGLVDITDVIGLLPHEPDESPLT